MNDKHKAFADEYLINGFNITQAYLTVYKSVTKEPVAAANGSRLLKNDKVVIPVDGKDVATAVKQIRSE